MKYHCSFLLGLLATLSTACASLTKEHCNRANWQSVGQSDGREGRPDHSSAIQARCASFGIKMDRSEYLRGYRMGLTAFCSRESGKYLALQGTRYERQCPVELESFFLEGYNEGRVQYEALEAQRKLVESVRAASVPRERKSCDFNSDCEIRSSCDDHRCQSTGATCTFDSDCTIRGSCNFNVCEFR